MQDHKEQSGENEIPPCDIHGADNMRTLAGSPICMACDSEEKRKERETYETSRMKEMKNKFRRDIDLPLRLQALNFENYKPVNKEAVKAYQQCRDFCRNFDIAGGLVMIGSVGTGKTHLAVSICHELANIGKESKFATVATIVREIKQSWSVNRNEKDSYGVPIPKDFESDIIDRYSNYPLLVIDEIGSQYGSDTEKIMITEIINNRYNNLNPTIVLGNVTLSEVKDAITTRAVDRILHNGSLVVFDWESYRKETE